MRLKSRQLAAVTIATLMIFSFQNCAKVGTNGIAVESNPSVTGANTDTYTDTDDDIPSEVTPVQFKQSFSIFETQKIDILFVVDNSGSMAYEQRNMASRLSDFISIVSGLDWQIAVTTTDASNNTYGDGRLVNLSGQTDSYILNSSMDENSAQQILGNTIQRSEVGGSSEQGIYATRRAIERSIASDNPKNRLVRSDAALAVVLISDEDESRAEAKNSPKNLISYIDQQYSSRKSFTFHSIISRPGDMNCLRGEGKTEGHRYHEISKLTGGIIGDVCAADYSSQIKGIAEGIKKSAQSIALSCTPLQSVNTPIVVTQNNQPVQNFTINGKNLEFTSEMPVGDYDVSYYCAK